MSYPNNDEDETVIVPSGTLLSDATIINSKGDDETVVSKTSVTEDKPKTSESLKVGSLLQNRFVLKEVLGSGGMGTVFRATDLRREEAQDQHPDVAIKVLNDEFRNDPELFIALQRETKKSQLLAHPNIVTVYDFDRDGNNVFMVMELLQGKPLSQFIREESSNGMSFKNAWHIIKGLALALAYAHKKNIIHSDFKPGNVFITSEGGVKVLDFGIACAAGRSDIHEDDTVFNARDLGALTPAYASLEMLQGKDPDPADDVYALACVCYQILSGKHPYGKLSAQKALEVNIEVPVISALDRRVRYALQHGLALKREQRTATVSLFLDEIEPKSIWPKVFVVLAIVTVLATAGGYYYVFYEMDFIDDDIIQLSEEQKLAIKDLLELAQIHFEVGYLTAPSGSNALWAYKQVLEIDPYNQDALKGLKKIAAVVKQQALEFYNAGNYKASLSKIEEGLEAVPKDQKLLELQDQILKEGVGLSH